MNNTTRTTLTVAVAILMAATIVVGGSIAATTGQSAYAFQKKGDKGNGNGNGNGNTITIQKCKQAATQSGWDNDQEQECENLICTHPGENATCVQEEGAVSAAAAQAPIKLTCEQCFMKFLTPQQINDLIADVPGDITSLPGLCNALERQFLSEAELRDALTAQVSTTIANEIIACLLQAGIVFPV